MSGYFQSVCGAGGRGKGGVPGNVCLLRRVVVFGADRRGPSSFGVRCVVVFGADRRGSSLLGFRNNCGEGTPRLCFRLLGECADEGVPALALITPLARIFVLNEKRASVSPPSGTANLDRLAATVQERHFVGNVVPLRIKSARAL